VQVWALVLTAWEMSSDATFRNLSTREARAVAQAIGGISSGAGKPLRVQPPTPPGLPPRFYQVIVPELEAAPVIIYRQLAPSEGTGYFVTALPSRSDYESYERAGRLGHLDETPWQLVTSLASTVATSVAGTISAAVAARLGMLRGSELR
jgi:hypothetical protein